MARLWIGALLLLASAPANAQDTKPVFSQAPPTLRITVTLVQVDAVVTDSQGRHVANLSPSDFEILQDGIPQKITFFSYTPEPEPVAQAPERKSKKDEERLPVGAPAPITAGQVKRTVALVVDDLALSFENLTRVRDSLRKFVERQMQPGDLVSVVRTGGGVAILEQFTTDKRILLEAIDLMKWRFYGRTGLGPIRPSPDDPASRRGASPNDPQFLDYGVSLAALGAIGTIEQVIEGMKKLPGRKSIVFLSDGLRMDPSIYTAMDRVTDMANRSAVSLYTVDPGGLKAEVPMMAEEDAYIFGPGAAPGGASRDTPFPRPRQGAGSAPGDDPDTPLDSYPASAPTRFPTMNTADDFLWREGLSYLATRTGGIFFANHNDIPELIRKATDDQLGYYLLGYSPQEGTFETDPHKAKFHKILVKVNRPGLRVRWKSGFSGVPDELTLTENEAPKTREEQLLDALASPFAATGLKVRLTSIYTDVPKTGPIVHSMLHFDGKDLTFTQDDDGNWTAGADIVTLVYRGVKQTLQQKQHVEKIRIPDGLYQKALKEGFLYYINDPIKEAGMFLIRAVVRDTASGRIGSATQYVQVPDTRKGQFALSGILVRLATPQILKDSGMTEAAGGKAEEWSEGGPSMRRYHPGQAMLYGAVVLNARSRGSAKETDVISEIRLFRNGQPIYTGEPKSIPPASRLDSKRLIGAGVLRLGSALRPGEYLLQMRVTDKLAKKKKSSQATQWVDFEIVPSPPLPGPSQ